MDYLAHGGRIFEAAEALNRPWQTITDFSANINPFGQLEGLKEFVFLDFERTLHYPEEKAQSLTQIVGEVYQISPDHFLPSAGSTVHIFLLARTLDPGLSVIVAPAFAEYEAALKSAGRNFAYVLTEDTDDFLVTEETLERIFSLNPKTVILANPANPTGRLVPEMILKKLLAETKKRRIYLVVDEAFIDFTTASSLVPEILKHESLVVLKSLTKIMAVPGLRIAYLASSPALIKKLWTQLGPWPLSSTALSAGLYFFSMPKNRALFIKLISSLRNKLTRVLQKFGQPFPSEANFLLFKYQYQETKKLIEFFFSRGLLVRDAKNFRGLGPGWLRLAVRPEDEIQILKSLLAEFHA
ncbi:MAG: aminotransferase class I/II-fold pyridoxal phosphate-dependent enzyme [Deltaproteobacteria bacterium]|jgi:threonine-phosphate decarboxylase|nr:aminotransferase class I/II-fold pyridoxal phosphate-dependent enzyme [Deltaproteobacteria bacterium]